MAPHYLTVDGFRYSTGIRDPFSSEYLELDTLSVSTSFRQRFASWLQRYQQAYPWYDEDNYQSSLRALDEEGLRLAKEMKILLGGKVKITYYSDAFCTSFLT